MELDGLLLGLGSMLTVFSLTAIFRPQALVRESRRNRDARLRELDAGALEKYFEERRELEAYPPRFDFSHETLRRIGLGVLALGLAAVTLGIL